MVAEIIECRFLRGVRPLWYDLTLRLSPGVKKLTAGGKEICKTRMAFLRKDFGFWAPECCLEVPIYLFTGRYLYSWRSKGLIRAAGPKCRVHLRSSGLGRSYKFTWLHGEFEIKKNLIKLWKLKILSGSILSAFKVNLLSIVRKYCCLRKSWIRSLLKFY